MIQSRTPLNHNSSTVDPETGYDAGLKRILEKYKTLQGDSLGVEDIFRRTEEIRAASILNPLEDSQNTFEDGLDLGVFERQGFVGQDYAIHAAKEALDVRVATRVATSPLIFVFVGPPGTGKTLLSGMIAQSYNSGRPLPELEKEWKYKKIPMVNYQTKEDVDALVGPRSGLQGSGLLTEILKNEKRSVIVLDEIEKAHPSFLESSLLPVLDENGVVQEKKNNHAGYPTRHAIFILTSNCLDDRVAPLVTKYDGDYNKIVREMDTLLSTEQFCRAGVKNPFRNGDVRRRLAAGHQFNTTYGFILFMPPTDEAIRQMVDTAMEKTHYEFKRSDSDIVGLYWTLPARKHIIVETMSRVVKRRESIAEISKHVENQAKVVFLKAIRQKYAPRDEQQEHKVLFRVENGELVSRLYCKGEFDLWIEIGQKTTSDTSTHRLHANTATSSRYINPTEEAIDAPARSSRTQHQDDESQVEWDCEFEENVEVQPEIEQRVEIEPEVEECEETEPDAVYLWMYKVVYKLVLDLMWYVKWACEVVVHILLALYSAMEYTVSCLYRGFLGLVRKVISSLRIRIVRFLCGLFIVWILSERYPILSVISGVLFIFYESYGMGSS